MDKAKQDLLVIAAQGGDQRAFEALYQLHTAALQRFAYHLCRDQQLALDAVQDAWITLSKTLRRLDDPRGFRVWAYKVVRWRITDAVRKRPGGKEVPIEGTAAETVSSAEPGATSGQLAALLAALPCADRQILVLFYLEEMKIAEIAGVLDIPVGTVKSRLNGARTRLRQQIEGDD